MAAGRYLQSLPEVDGEKIGLWGGSYGGFLTAMGLARNSDLFKAGVDFHGVHDWSVFLTERPISAIWRCARRTRRLQSSWRGIPRPMPT